MTIQFLRGNTENNDALVRPEGAISLDLESPSIRVHDGVTEGGLFFGAGNTDLGANTDLSANYDTDTFTITSSSGANVSVNAATSTQAGAMSSTDKDKLNGIQENAQVNRETSSQSEAETGENNDTVLTPLRAVQLIEAGNYNIDEGSL